MAFSVSCLEAYCTSNARHELLGAAGATQERTQFPVSSMPLFGSDLRPALARRASCPWTYGAMGPDTLSLLCSASTRDACPLDPLKGSACRDAPSLDACPLFVVRRKSCGASVFKTNWNTSGRL